MFSISSFSIAAGFFSGGRLALDEADSASPERQRIESLPSQNVTSAGQDRGAYQNCQCHHLFSSLGRSPFHLLFKPNVEV